MTKKKEKDYESEVSLYIHHYNPPFKKKFGTKENSVLDFVWWNFQFVYKDGFDKQQYVQQLTVAFNLDKYEDKVSFNTSYSETHKETFSRVFNAPLHSSIKISNNLEPKKNCHPVALTIKMNDYSNLESLLNTFIEKEIFIKLDSIEDILKENPIAIYKNELINFISSAKDKAKKLFTVENFENIKSSSQINDILLFNYLDNNPKLELKTDKHFNKKKI